MKDFDHDPIISEKIYPEVQELFKLQVLEISSKHFYNSDREKLQELDKLLYYLIAPYANLSLVNTFLIRNELPYYFSPIGYTKCEKTFDLYRKYKLEVFTDLIQLENCIRAFQ